MQEQVPGPGLQDALKMGRKPHVSFLTATTFLPKQAWLGIGPLVLMESLPDSRIPVGCGYRIFLRHHPSSEAPPPKSLIPLATSNHKPTECLVSEMGS